MPGDSQEEEQKQIEMTMGNDNGDNKTFESVSIQYTLKTIRKYMPLV